ncbi:MAG: DUF4342 domain-containing protein [bacterium]
MITLEAVDQVIERTGCTYKEAKEALTKTDGDVIEAIILIQSAAAAKSMEVVEGEPADDAEEETAEEEEPSQAAKKLEELKEKIRKSVRDGSVNKIRITRGGKELLVIPVNLGLVGGVIGITAAPWAVIFGAVAAYGLDCKFEIVKDDGSIMEL